MSLLALAIMAALPGLWMVTGVADNWRVPELNRATVERVMRLELMERDYPDDFARVAHRRVESRAVINTAFRLIVVIETLAAILLVGGAGLLALAALGVAEPALARSVALAGALVFTAVWGGFLIGGNYFCYYYCHYEGQFTHFLLAIWGSITVAVLM